MSFEVLYPTVAPVVSRVWPLVREGDVEVLQPEEIEAVVPPAILSGGLDRVSGAGAYSVLAEHMATAVADRVTHAAVLRKRTENALVYQKGYSTLYAKTKFAPRSLLERLALPSATVSRLRYPLTFCAWKFFGHWLLDAIPTTMIDAHDGSDAWLPSPSSWAHCEAYKELFGVDAVQHRVVVANELVTYQDFGQGSHKRARYRRLREILSERYAKPDPAECVYMRRGNTGVRRTIANEDRLLEELVRRGWTVLDIAGASVDDIQSVLVGARVVASIDGSHIRHAHLSIARGGVMMVMVPHDQFTTIHLGLCRANRVNCGFLVVEGNAEDGYQVDIDEFLSTVDLAAKGPY